jgi:hypothetical protein
MDDKDGDINYVNDLKGTKGKIKQQNKSLGYYGI